MISKVLFTISLFIPLTDSISAFADDQINDTQSALCAVERLQSPLQRQVKKVSRIFRKLTIHSDSIVPTSVINHARCIVVIPNVTPVPTVSANQEKNNGNGLASCKNGSGPWTQPAAIYLHSGYLHTGNLGRQTEQSSTEVVLFFQSVKAEELLKKGNLILGTDLQIVPGMFDRTYQVANEDVIAYATAAGVFTGITIDSCKLSRDDAKMSEYYGKRIEYRDLLDGNRLPDKTCDTTELTSALP